MLNKPLDGKSVSIYETTEIGILLAMVGGFLDTYTYILRGGVFANAQTGNLVLLGISFARGEFSRVFYYFIPVLSFVAGVFISEWIKRRRKEQTPFHEQHIILAIEAFLLFLIGFLPPEIPNTIVNVTVSFICSLQVNSFRQLVGTAYASTMCTGNLRSATENIAKFLFDNDISAKNNCLRYSIIIASFCIGAGIGIPLTNAFRGYSIFFASGVFVILLFIQKN